MILLYLPILYRIHISTVTLKSHFICRSDIFTSSLTPKPYPTTFPRVLSFLMSITPAPLAASIDLFTLLLYFYVLSWYCIKVRKINRKVAGRRVNQDSLNPILNIHLFSIRKKLFFPLRKNNKHSVLQVFLGPFDGS